MDYRFPKWLRVVVDRLSFLAIPNLGGLLAGIAVIAFIANTLYPASMNEFVFDAYKILYESEWWRLFTFPFMAGFKTPFWLLMYCLYVYFIMQMLEQNWGAAPLTVYVLFSYLSAIGGALILRAPVDLSTPILSNISLALGTLLPNLELSLFFILPVKAKWLAAFAGALIFLTFLQGPTAEVRLFYLCSHLPYIVFFGPLGIKTVREKWKSSRNRKKFDQSMWR